MGESWYKKCLPKVSEVKESLPHLKSVLSNISGIKTIRIFGSLAENISDDKCRIKDIDVIAVTPFHSEDLLAITSDALSTKTEFLEEEGLDVKAVKFSKGFTRTTFQYPLDFWVLSKDKKLLHWDPFLTTKEESNEIKAEAETFASEKTGFNLSKIAKSNDEGRDIWYDSFRAYIQRQFDNQPTGWYQSEEKDIKSILASSFELT